MSIENNKLMNLADGKVLYDDLRGRIESPLTATITTPAAIQSFSDGAEWGMNLKAAVDPVQGLHGYDNPWPAGGGKNLIGGNTSSSSGDVTYTVNSDGTISTSGTASADSTFDIIPNEFKEISFSSGETFVLSGCPANGGSNKYRIRIGRFYNGTRYGGYVYDNGSGATFDPTDSLPEEAIAAGKVTINAKIIVYSGQNASGLVFSPMLRNSTVQDATYAPYSNICPITGWTGAQISVTGKNIFDSDGARWNNNSFINSSGVVQSNESYRYSRNYTRVKGGETITISLKRTTTGFGNPMSFYDENKVFIQRVSTISTEGTGTLTATITTPANASWFRINDGMSSGSTEIMVEYGSTATTYEPYGATYPISFGSAGTVYGGELTVNADGTGTLVVDTIKRTITGTDIASAGSYPDLAGYYFARTGDNTNIHDIVGCDSFRTIHEPLTEKIPSVYTTNTRIYFYSDLYTSKEEAVSYFNSNPVNILIELTTPIVYSLSAPQVLSLLGLNNVWCDTGNITELEYVRRQDLGFIREDTAGQIKTVVDPVKDELDDTQAAMAIVVDGDTAPKNITSGQYVFVKNHSTLASGMYHATEAISSGASVTGSNVSADGDGAVNALNNKFVYKSGDTIVLYRYTQVSYTPSSNTAQVYIILPKILSSSRSLTFASTPSVIVMGTDDTIYTATCSLSRYNDYTICLTFTVSSPSLASGKWVFTRISGTINIS